MSTLTSENMEQLELMRTPMRMKNQDFTTPANGKLHSRFNKNLFVTPTKRGVTATPRSVLGNKTNIVQTPNTNAFKRPKLSPSLKVTLKNKSPRFRFCQNSTPSKFSVYEDGEDEVLSEMKQKNFKIETPEKCPWATSVHSEDFKLPNPPLELIDDYVPSEPLRKKLKPLDLAPLPHFDSEITHVLEPLPDLPDIANESDHEDEAELCPWADFTQDDVLYNDSLPIVELDDSELSELNYTRQCLSEISIRCFDESIRTLEEGLSGYELPDIPSTPDLDQELAELLELSFDPFNL